MFNSLLRAAAIAALLACADASAGNGDADPTFGAGGVVIINYDLANTNGAEFGTRTLVQPQGYVLVGTISVGNNVTPEYDLFLTRVDRNGAVDAAFGTGGGLTRLSATGQFDFVGGASIAPDDSLLVVVHGAFGGDPSAVVKLSADGIPDNSFGSGGVVLLPNFTAGDVIGLGGGKVLVSGLYAGLDFAVLRLDADGSADTTFGNQTPMDGFALSPGGDLVNAMVVQTDGKIVLAGSGDFGFPSGDDFYVMRFTDTGDVDTTFNNTGTVQVGFDRCGSNPSFTFQNRDVVNALAVQPNGAILVAGTAAGYCDAPTGNLGSAAGVVRLNADGTIDNDFGKQLLQHAIGYDTQGAGIVFQGGRIFVATTANGGFATGTDFGLAHLNYSGTPHLAWGNAGYTHYDLGLATNDTAAAMVLDGMQPIVIGTRDVTYPDTDMGVLRISNDSIFGDGFD